MQRKILVGVGMVLVVSALGIFIRSQLTTANAGLVIQSDPSATVFIDDVQVGTTPVETVRKSGEILVKLLPFSQTDGLTPYETKVVLTAGVSTIIHRVFGTTDETSSGEVLSFEKVGGRAASMAVVSSPDAAQITIDGKNVGFSPTKLDSLEAGDHLLKISAPGYTSRELAVKAVAGYRLTAVVKLAKSSEAQAQEQQAQQSTPSGQIKKTMIEILPTPTGFLRVRQQASTTATESARVTPGQRYAFVEENSDKSWYKIEYQTGKTGWISSQYAKRVEE